MPPAATTERAPASIARIAYTIASSPDAQTLLTVSAVTVLAKIGLEHDLASRILSGAGLQHLTEDRMLDVARVDAGAFDWLRPVRTAPRGGRFERSEAAAKFAEGGASGREYDRFGLRGIHRLYRLRPVLGPPLALVKVR